MRPKELSWLYSNQERRYLGTSTTHARKPPLHQPGKRFKQVKQQSCCTIVVWLRLRVKTLGQKDTHTITQHTKCLFWSRFFVPKYLYQYQLELFPPSLLIFSSCLGGPGGWVCVRGDPPPASSCWPGAQRMIITEEGARAEPPDHQDHTPRSHRASTHSSSFFTPTRVFCVSNLIPWTQFWARPKSFAQVPQKRGPSDSAYRKEKHCQRHYGPRRWLL